MTKDKYRKILMHLELIKVGMIVAGVDESEMNDFLMFRVDFDTVKDVAFLFNYSDTLQEICEDWELYELCQSIQNIQEEIK